MKESEYNVEEVKINLQLKDQKREIQAKIIEKWKNIVEDQDENNQKKLTEEKSLGDKTGKQVQFNYFIIQILIPVLSDLV